MLLRLVFSGCYASIAKVRTDQRSVFSADIFVTYRTIETSLASNVFSHDDSGPLQTTTSDQFLLSRTTQILYGSLATQSGSMSHHRFPVNKLDRLARPCVSSAVAGVMPGDTSEQVRRNAGI